MRSAGSSPTSSRSSEVMSRMPPWLAGIVVFFTSGAVLLLEILAGRLLAPYVGIRLETYTAIIGTVLAGISLGTWLGGRMADRIDPRRTLGPLMVAGGALAMLSLPAVRATGTAGLGQADDILVLAITGFLAPSAVLSRRPPHGREAAAAGPRGDRAGGGAPLRAGHRRRHRRDVPGRVRAGGGGGHQRRDRRRGCCPGGRRPAAVGRSGPAPAPGDHAGALAPGRGGSRGAGVGGGRSV